MSCWYMWQVSTEFHPFRGLRGGTWLSCMSASTAGIGERRPQEEAFDEALGLKSGLRLKWWRGDSSKWSSPSDTEEDGLWFSGIKPFLSASNFFLTLPLFFSNLEVSILVALLLAAFPGLASGLIIHQLLLPVPSFCTLMKRLCRERLCRMEF